MNKNIARKLVSTITCVVGVSGIIGSNPGLYEALLDSLLGSTDVFAFSYGETKPQSTNNCALNEWNIEPMVRDISPAASIYQSPDWRNGNPTSNIQSYKYYDFTQSSNFSAGPSALSYATSTPTSIVGPYSSFSYNAMAAGDTLTLSDGSILKTNLAESNMILNSAQTAIAVDGNRVIQQEWTRNQTMMNGVGAGVQIYPLSGLNFNTRVGDIQTVILYPWEITNGLDFSQPFSVQITPGQSLVGTPVVFPDNSIHYSISTPMINRGDSYFYETVEYQITQAGQTVNTNISIYVTPETTVTNTVTINPTVNNTFNLSDLLVGEERYTGTYTFDKAQTEALNITPGIFPTVLAGNTQITIPAGLADGNSFNANYFINYGSETRPIQITINTNAALIGTGVPTLANNVTDFRDNQSAPILANAQYYIKTTNNSTKTIHPFSSSYGFANNIENYSLSFSNSGLVTTASQSGVNFTINPDQTITVQNTTSAGSINFNLPIYITYKPYGTTITQQVQNDILYYGFEQRNLITNKIIQWVIQPGTPTVTHQTFNLFGGNYSTSGDSASYYAHTVSAQKSPAAIATGTSLFGSNKFNSYGVPVAEVQLGYPGGPYAYNGTWGTVDVDGVNDVAIGYSPLTSSFQRDGTHTTAHAFSFFPALGNCTPPVANTLTAGTIPTLSENPVAPNHLSTLTLTLSQPPAAAQPVVYTITTDNQCRVRTSGSGLGFSSTFVTTGQTTTTTTLDVQAVDDGILETPLHSCAISIVSSSTNARDNGLTTNRTIQIQDYNLVVVPPIPNLNAPSGKMEVTKSPTKLAWKQTWFNNSNAVNLKSRITNTLPTGVTYTSGTLVCTVRGTSTTDSCGYDSNTRSIAWIGTLAADPAALFAYTSGNEKVLGYDANNSLNSLEIVFESSPNTTSYDITNIANAFWDQNGDGIINNGDTNVQNNTPIVIKRQVVQEAILLVANTGAKYSIPSISIVIIIVGAILAAIQIKKIRDGKEYALVEVPATSIPKFGLTNNMDGHKHRR